MKIYGMPRKKLCKYGYPDVGDIQDCGLNTSAGGRDYFKNKREKAATRRYFKRLARRAGKNFDFS